MHAGVGPGDVAHNLVPSVLIMAVNGGKIVRLNVGGVSFASYVYLELIFPM